MIRKPIGKLKDAGQARKLRRKLSIRKKLSGTAERPRLSLSKTNKHLVIQAIDDNGNVTLFSVQTFGKSAVQAKSNVEGAKLVGAKVAQELKSRKIETAVFDRNGLKYHGVVAALVDSARENGIKI